ncbi:hypothetical protein ACWF94_12980 [Streptomyces sp. NPDC055078]
MRSAPVERGPVRRAHPAARPVTAFVLLGMVFALLVVLCRPSYASGSADPGSDTGPVAVTVATAQGGGQPAGCGKGTVDDDGGAHPATPPRGGFSAELPPAPLDTHGGTGVPSTTAAPGINPERGPPPIAPPSPVNLSVLRV